MISSRRSGILPSAVANIPGSIVVPALVGAVLVVVFLAFALFADFIAPFDPTRLTDNVLSLPSSEHPFGTDTIGRDIFSRVIHGSRVSIPVALLAVAVASSIGATLGLISGQIGGRFDRLLAIPMDAVYAFPEFLLALTVALVLGPSVRNAALAVGFARIPTYYRVVRSVTLSLKERPLVEAEKALGAGDVYILFKHILPRAMSSIMVLVTFDTGRAVLMVAGLGFLGFGVPPPIPEWGTDLSVGRRVLLSGSWWASFFPGLAIFVLVLGFNLLGEGLNAVLNPKYKIR
jgi:peptide/nickel transport system permease protein